MIEIVIGSLVFLFMYAIVLATHEFGHWIALKTLRYKKIKFHISLTKDIEIGANLHKIMKLNEVLYVIIMGIVAGILPIVLFSKFVPQSISILLSVIYVMMCSGDIMTLHLITNQETFDMTLYEMNVKVWKDYQKKTRLYVKSK